MFRVDGEQIADQIVAGVGTFDRKGGVDITGDAGQIAGQQFADITLEDLQRRLAVERNDDVIGAFGDPMRRADGGAALGQAGRHLDRGREHHPGQAAVADAVGDLVVAAPR